MGLIKKNFREAAAVAAIIILAVGVSLTSTIYPLFNAPKDTFYTQVYNFVPDFFQFISWMKDGSEGKFALTSRFTPEEFPRKWGHTFFPALGFLGSKLGVDLFTVFTASRVILAAARLAAIYFLLIFLFEDRKKRILALLFVILLPSFVRVESLAKLDFRYFLPGITNFDVFARITFLPHHLLATILMVLFFIVFAQAISNNNKRKTIIASVLFITASLVNPATLVNMVFILGVFFVLLVGADSFTPGVRQLTNRTPPGWFKAFLIVGLAIAIVAAYYKFYLFTVFPWNNFYQAEIGNTVIGDWREYLGALGIALPLSFLALFNKKNSKNILFLLLVAWAYAPIFGFLLAKKMTILSPFRFFQAQQSIPLGILSAMGIFWLWERWKSKLMLFLLGIIIVATSIPYYSLTIAEQMKKSNATYNIFLPNDTLAAFQYLDKNSQNEAVVMAGFYTSWMLPAFSHNRVFAAHGDRTYEYEKKLDLLRIFYSGKPTIAEVKQLLEKYNISFILFTPDTPPPTDHIINKLPNIKLIYKRGNNYIYQRSWNL